MCLIFVCVWGGGVISQISHIHSLRGFLNLQVLDSSLATKLPAHNLSMCVSPVDEVGCTEPPTRASVYH